jgi:uncharacterized protein (TIRG00374 family)
MRLRHFFFFLALVLISLLIIVQFGQLGDFLSIIVNVNGWILLVVVFLRFLYYLTNTKYFQVYLKSFGYHLAFRPLFMDVVNMNFANTVFPTGGVSGIAVLRGRLRKHKVSAHTTTVAQAFWMGFTGISFIVLLLASMLLLFVSTRIEQVSFRLILAVLLFMLVGSLVIMALLLNRRVTERAVYFLTRPINFILKRFGRDSLGRQQLHDLSDKFYETLQDFKSDWRKLARPFSWCFITLVIDIASLYMVFVAFGVYPNPGVVTAAFLVAMVVSLASVVTSGIGVFEIGMVSVLVGLGLAFDVSFSATLVYRVIALWLFLPVGLYVYKKAMIDEK